MIILFLLPALNAIISQNCILYETLLYSCPSIIITLVLTGSHFLGISSVSPKVVSLPMSVFSGGDRVTQSCSVMGRSQGSRGKPSLSGCGCSCSHLLHICDVHIKIRKEQTNKKTGILQGHSYTTVYTLDGFLAA